MKRKLIINTYNKNTNHLKLKLRSKKFSHVSSNILSDLKVFMRVAADLVVCFILNLKMKATIDR